MINRPFFFDQVRRTLFDGRLRRRQVRGLDAILDVWEGGYVRKDDRWLAYMLATAHHETDRTMQPIREYGRGRNCTYGIPDPETKQVYYGRGFVQLTWRVNYEAMSKLVKDDLVRDADLALRPDYASIIMFEGMIRGSFTGRKLAHYFNPEKEDWVNARRIINGTDKAHAIAAYGKSYYAAISYTI